MHPTRFLKSGSVAFAVLALTVLVRCTSSAADGASCDKGSDCLSTKCVSGTCDGSECKCDGPDCHGQSSCLAGWLCTQADADTTGELIPQCRQQCTVAGTCPVNRHCQNGVCRTGAEGFSLTWVSFPRKPPCGAKVACPYEVTVTAGVTISKFTWTFGDAPSVDTTDPKTTFTYDATGTYPVRVHAVSNNGAVSDLAETEILCEGGRGGPCDVSGAPCCEGLCNLNLCQ